MIQLHDWTPAASPPPRIGTYLVTTELYGDPCVIVEAYNPKSGDWLVEGEDEADKRVIAWAPKPAPFIPAKFGWQPVGKKPERSDMYLVKYGKSSRIPSGRPYGTAEYDNVAGEWDSFDNDAILEWSEIPA